ncbi:MAG: hypothetical protein JWL90_1239, partial [Chthoniobacteraceae bacterium]|nr:hypothetical protein [Chthoniobacteraceae bacterium]
VGSIAKNREMPIWIRRASFSHNLSEIREGVFKVEAVFTDAVATLPLIDSKTVDSLTKAGRLTSATDFHGALWSLGALSALSLFVFLRKLRTE